MPLYITLRQHNSLQHWNKKHYNKESRGVEPEQLNLPSLLISSFLQLSMAAPFKMFIRNLTPVSS